MDWPLVVGCDYIPRIQEVQVSITSLARCWRSWLEEFLGRCTRVAAQCAAGLKPSSISKKGHDTAALKRGSSTPVCRVQQLRNRSRLELYGTLSRSYTQEMREWLGQDSVEYDVEIDRDARARVRSVAANLRTVPILLEEAKVVQVGWQERGCIVE